MAIRIAELICNVTVSLGSPPLASARATPEPDAGEAPSLPLEMVLPRALAASEARPDAAQGGEEASVAGGGPETGLVDPRVLTDRVYRLMKEDLEIARERE